jgi:hypothetical protein
MDTPVDPKDENKGGDVIMDDDPANKNIDNHLDEDLAVDGSGTNKTKAAAPHSNTKF